MKARLETIINAQQAFSELAKQPMSIKASYRIASLLKAIQRELDIYNEQRIKIFVDIGCPLSEDGKQYLVPQNKKVEFGEKYTELVAVEVDIPERLDLSDEEIRLSPAAVLDLEPFIILETE